MRRPVTVFAWIRHQQAIGYEVATRQQEVADRFLLPPARGAAEASQLSIRPGSALPPYGTHAGVPGSRNIPHAFMLRGCVQCAGRVRAEASGWGVGSSVGSRFECGRTWSDGAWPRESLVGSPGRGRGTQHRSRATPRNHATRVSTEPARSTPSRIAPALTRDRCGIVCCAPLYVTRLMSYVHAACSMRQPPPSPSAPARRVHPGNPHAPTSPKERRESV